MSVHRTHRKAASEGFIIVSVLWILSALATLAIVYAVYIRNSAALVRVNDDRLQAEALISAGLELAAYQLTAGQNPASTRGEFRFRMGRANVAVRFHPETSRIDLNFASKDLLAGLLSTLGAQPEDALTYADRIIGWRSPPRTQNEDQDEEASSYRTAGLMYKPRQAPFANILEIWLVRGIPSALIQRALPYLTVYSGQGEIDILDAAPQVLASMPGIDSERLQNLLTQRNILLAQGANNSRSLQPLLGSLGLAQAAPEGSSKCTRVAIRIVFDNGRRVGADSVIVPIDGGTDPYRVLFWRDDFDQLILDDQDLMVTR